MERVLLNIALILIFTKTSGIISRKFKMPEVLGALIAGVIIGPVLLNLVHYDNNLKLLSNIGVIMLMFLAGLETNVDEFKKAGLSSLVIAIGGILVPLILGTLSTLLFFHNIWENIFVGVILTATSVSITAETLKELGKLNSRAGINILGAAVIDDILGLILISFVLAFAQTADSVSNNSGALTIIIILLKIFIFTLLAIIGILFIPKLMNKYTHLFKPNRDTLTLCIAFAIFVAFVAEKLGIAAITGAYLFGLMLSKYTHREYLEKRIKAISTAFLSLIFFASVGIEADIVGVNSELILMTLVMFLVALIGKIAGCFGAARLLRIDRREALQIGVGMISRGEVALITANIGLQKGIISENIFLPTVIVVVLTTIITPILLKMSFSGRAKA